MLEIPASLHHWASLICLPFCVRHHVINPSISQSWRQLWHKDTRCVWGQRDGEVSSCNLHERLMAFDLHWPENNYVENLLLRLLNCSEILWEHMFDICTIMYLLKFMIKKIKHKMSRQTLEITIKLTETNRNGKSWLQKHNNGKYNLWGKKCPEVKKKWLLKNRLHICVQFCVHPSIN